MKRCLKCNETKSTECFGKRKGTKDGLERWCRPCLCKQAANWRARNKRKIKRYGKTGYLRRKKKTREEQKRYYADNKVAIFIQKAKIRAVKKGLDFNLEKSDIIIPEFCPILGIPLFSGDGKMCDNSPTLDRIDNSKGYIKGNVMVISYKANRMKSNATIEELSKFVIFISRQLNALRKELLATLAR